MIELGARTARTVFGTALLLLATAVSAAAAGPSPAWRRETQG